MYQHTILNRFRTALILLFILLFVGVSGYMLIEDYNFGDAFYMTIITLSTVGFKEVRPLSPAGQYFTSFLVIGSFGTFAYSLSLLAQALISGELARDLKRRNLDKNISKVEGHVILCGFGRNGRRAYQRLMAYGQQVLVIERDKEIIERYLAEEKILYLEGDATDDNILQKAGVERAKALVTTLSKDADNLFVVISARTLSNSIKLISRASTESTEKKLRAVGVNSVVMPEGVGGGHMASLVMNPNIVEFLEHLSIEGNSEINLEEVELKEITGNTQTCTLEELQIRQQTGCTVIGIKETEGEYQINPSKDQILKANSRLFVLGNNQQIQALYDLLKLRGKRTLADENINHGV